MLDSFDVSKVSAIIAAAGLLIPALQAIIQRPLWSSRAKSFLTVALSILAGLVAYVADNGLDFSSPSSIVAWIVGVYGATIIAYHGLLKPSGIAGGIEAGTSPAPAEDEVDPDEVEEAEVPVATDPPDGFDDGSDPKHSGALD